MSIGNSPIYFGFSFLSLLQQVIRLNVIVTDISAPVLQQGKGLLIITVIDVNELPPVSDLLLTNAITIIYLIYVELRLNMTISEIFRCAANFLTIKIYVGYFKNRTKNPCSVLSLFKTFIIHFLAKHYTN